MVEFDHFRMQAGSNAFTLSPSRWIEATNILKFRKKWHKNLQVSFFCCNFAAQNVNDTIMPKIFEYFGFNNYEQIVY